MRAIHSTFLPLCAFCLDFSLKFFFCPNDLFERRNQTICNSVALTSSLHSFYLLAFVFCSCLRSTFVPLGSMCSSPRSCFVCVENSVHISLCHASGCQCRTVGVGLSRVLSTISRTLLCFIVFGYPVNDTQGN